MKNTLNCVVKLSLMFLCANAFAQESPKTIYFGGNVGYSSLSDQTGSVNSQLVGALGGTAQSSQNNAMAAFRLFGGFIANENLAIELGYVQTSKETLNFTGRSLGGVNYTGNLNSTFNGADLGFVLRPSQSTGFQNIFLDLGLTSYTAKETGNISTNVSSYSPSQNEQGTGHFYGLGYDMQMQDNYVLRALINHYDKIGGNSGLSGNVASIGLLKKF